MSITTTPRRNSLAIIESLESRAYCSADLVATSVSVAAPKNLQVKPGQKAIAAIVITNSGDTLVNQAVTIAIDITPNSDGSSATPLTPLTKKLHIKSGAVTTVKIPEKIPVGFKPGVYYFFGLVEFNDPNSINNFATSQNTLTVLNPYPVLTGTWQGTAIIRKGLGKGQVVQQVVTFTNEDDTTGVYIFTGTNTFADNTTSNFSGQGIIKTNGVFTASGSSDDQSALFTDKGRVTGHKIHGTYINALNSGTFSSMQIG